MPQESEASGVNNHRNWTSSPGKKHRDMLAHLVSIHESYHTMLNSTSAYGLLLLAYSQGAKNALKDQEKFGAVFRLLMPSCAFTHEWGATFPSMMVMLAEGFAGDVNEMLSRFPNYTVHYDAAEALVKDIPGYHLKQLVILMATGAAMQGKAVGEAALRHPLDFSLSMVRAVDLPDNRLKKIRQQFSPADIRRLAEDLLQEVTGSEYEAFVKHELTAPRQPAYATSPIFQAVTGAISLHFYKAFQDFFDRQSLATYGFEEHMNYGAQLIQTLEPYFDQEKSKDFFEVSPYDLERLSLATMETEAITLADPKRQCYLLFPGQVHEALRLDLLRGDALRNLVVMFRHSLAIRKQYQFRESAHDAWLGQNSRTICFVRTVINMDGLVVVVIIPFEDPGSLGVFLEGRPAGTNVIGCFSLTAFEDRRWWEEQLREMCEHVPEILLLNDESLLYNLDRMAPAADLEQLYCVLPVNVADIKSACMLMRTRSSDGHEKITVVPGGIAFLNSAQHYILKRMPFLEFAEFADVALEKAVHSIMWSVYSQESEWSFWLARY